MNSNSVFEVRDETLKARLETYWAVRLSRLERLLRRYNIDPQDVRLTVRQYRQSRAGWYQARANTHLPSGTLAEGEAYDKDPFAALGRAADRLVEEIKRESERVRQDYLLKRKARRRADLGAAVPLLERHVGAGQREDFDRLLRPLLRFLREHARRKLHALEQDGLLHRWEMTADDLVDEVLTRAWERFADRPRDQPLDVWLTDLFDEALEDWVKEEPRPHASLEVKADEVAPDQVPRPDELEWWVDVLDEYQERLKLEDLLPDWKEKETWERLRAEGQKERLRSLLKELPEAQREAFLLHALADYDPAEIAKLQDRPESEVRADIEAARRALKERLSAEGFGEEATRAATAASAPTRAGRESPETARSEG